MDIVELSLYNSVLSGESLDGTAFFYVNPLRSVRDSPAKLRWSHERRPFLSSFCCPPNLARTIAEVSMYAYSKSEDAIWINLYGGSRLETQFASGKLALTQETEYPWNGRVRLIVQQCPATEFSLKLRIPGWTERFGLRINNQLANAPTPSGSYASVRRIWRAGDVVDIAFPMPTRLVEANPLVEETLNQVALKRGPLVYCLESPDLPRGVHLIDVSVRADVDLVARFDSSLLSGVVTVDGTGWARQTEDWTGALYRPLTAATAKPANLHFIPYFAWANRGNSDMSVWLPIR